MIENGMVLAGAYDNWGCEEDEERTERSLWERMIWGDHDDWDEDDWYEEEFEG